MKTLILIAAAAVTVTALAAPSWQQDPLEDEPGFNCLTMGNNQCGPGYGPLDQDTIAAFTQSDAEHGAHDWSACLTTATTPLTIVCPDGYTTTANR